MTCPLSLYHLQCESGARRGGSEDADLALKGKKWLESAGHPARAQPSVTFLRHSPYSNSLSR